MINLVPRAYHKFEHGESAFELWRLEDREYYALREYSFPIREDGMVLMDLRLSDRRKDRELMLPKLLVALEEDYGESSRSIDTWKQTFSFPLLLSFTKAGQSWPYVLKLSDFRGCLEFDFYRVVDDLKYAEVKREVYQEPIEGELGKAEMGFWISYLWGYFHAASEIWCRYKISMNELTPFFRHIDSNHILYGFGDGEFFEYQIANEKKYERRVAELRQKYDQPKPTLVEEIEVTQAFLQAIWQSNEMG